MANKGKRMVFEKDIARIGQGGGGGSYTAGNGINISEEDVISVDTETVATKTDLTGYVDTSTNQNVGGQKTFTDTTSVVYQTEGVSGGTTLYNGAVGVAFGTAQGLLQPDNLTLSGTSTPYITAGVTGQTSGRYNLPAGKTGDVAITSEIPAAVSGTNDGTNWTSLTVGTNTYAIPQGGSSYSAGAGIDITNNTISVDNTIATKAEVNIVAGKFYSYTETASNVYDELVAEDPATTNQQAVTEWLKRMPTFVSTNIELAGLSQLQGMGFKNIIQIEPGARYDIQGYFSIIMEDGSKKMPQAMQVCLSDRAASATASLWNKTTTRIQHTVVIGSNQIEFQNSRFREANTSMAIYNNLFGNSIAVVQQMGVNAQTDALLGMSNAMISFAGREAETIGISVQGGLTNANNAFNTQLAVPQSNGYYQLNCTVSGDVPTFEWRQAAAVPTVDGTYTLKVTVTSGVPVFSWVLDNQ